MQEDPRHRNERCDTASVGAYLFDYADRLRAALLTVDPAFLERARVLVEEAASTGRRIYSVGNGGSAAIADHLCCDFTKGTHAPGHPVVDSMSLVSNVALYSAIANDFGFEKVFSTQVGLLGRPGDVLVAISSSGNSPNILAAVDAAHAAGMATIGMSGFRGGALRDRAQVPLYVDANNYGVVEDAHQALMHVLAQFIAARRDG
ncbi:SIS domain-containing protein [Roseomonas sp. BN140053]|uniref:SIS domain-containing protein n=1 Tax=Roseomonas sp. BN140053 TaxID=3391898 RepID=UPI0039EADE2C